MWLVGWVEGHRQEEEDKEWGRSDKQRSGHEQTWTTKNDKTIVNDSNK